MSLASVPLRARLMLITDTAVAPLDELVRRACEFCRGAEPNSVIVQLRDRALATRERVAFGHALAGVVRTHRQLLLINDGLDLAKLLRADGVHLGEESVDNASARAFLGAGTIISRAWHPRSPPTHGDLEPLLRGGSAPNVVLMSPVMAERKGRVPLGLPGVRQARALFDAAFSVGSRPLLLALGGVQLSSVSELLEAGADGVAAIRAVWEAPAAEPWLRALHLAPPPLST